MKRSGERRGVGLEGLPTRAPAGFGGAEEPCELIHATSATAAASVVVATARRRRTALRRSSGTDLGVIVGAMVGAMVGAVEAAFWSAAATRGASPEAYGRRARPPQRTGIR